MSKRDSWGLSDTDLEDVTEQLAEAIETIEALADVLREIYRDHLTADYYTEAIEDLFTEHDLDL